MIKQELKAKGIKAEVLNRINAYIPFKKLLMKDHVRIADLSTRPLAGAVRVV